MINIKGTLVQKMKSQVVLNPDIRIIKQCLKPQGHHVSEVLRAPFCESKYEIKKYCVGSTPDVMGPEPSREVRFVSSVHRTSSQK